MVISGLADKLANVFLFAIIARLLTRSDFGAYSLILTLVFLGSVFSNFGLDSITVREIAKNRVQAGRIFNNALLIALVFSILIWPLTILFSRLMHYSGEILYLITCGGFVFIFMGLGQTATSAIKAFERMEIISIVSCAYSITGLLLSILVLCFGGGIKLLFSVYVFTEAVKALLMILIVHKKFCPIHLCFDKVLSLSLIKQSVPFALLMAYGLLHRKIDLLIMGLLKPLDDVAIYGMASKFYDFLSIFTSSMLAALFPAFSSMTDSKTASRLWDLYNDSIAVFAILGVAACGAVFVLAEPVIDLVFGQQYLAGAETLCWLGLAFLFSVMAGPAGTVLLAYGNQIKQVLFMCVIVLSCNIFLNFCLIPKFSYRGAAIATVISTALGFVLRLFLSYRQFGRFPSITKTAGRPVFAGLIMVLFLSGLMTYNLNIFLLILAGGTVYFLCLTILGEFKQERYRPLIEKLSNTINTTTK